VRQVITPLSTAQTESVHSRVRINTLCAGQVDLDASGSGILDTALEVLSIAVFVFADALYRGTLSILFHEITSTRFLRMFDRTDRALTSLFLEIIQSLASAVLAITRRKIFFSTPVV